MKRFFISILCATVFFIGLGTMFEKTAATFKSDEKALELIRKARQAIGGDSAINNVKSMTIFGKLTKNFEAEGIARLEGGETEINFELPNKMTKTVKIGAENGDGNRMVDKKVEVIVMKKDDADIIKWKTEGGDNIKTDGIKKIIVKKADGTEEVVTEEIKPIIIRKNDGKTTTLNSEDGKITKVENKKFVFSKDEKSGEHFRSNELFRTTLSLLLSAPEGLDVSYVYVGEGNVDGNSVEIVEARTIGSNIKLFLDKSSNLPRMITFQDHKPLIFKVTTQDVKPDANGETQVFTRTMAEPEIAEFQVKFSDFRSVNGIQLPFKWTQTVNGKTDETIDITSYEINPANIADKFKEVPRVMVRTQKEQ